MVEAASRGAREAGGMVVGILPGNDREDANPWADVVLSGAATVDGPDSNWRRNRLRSAPRSDAC